MKKKLAMGTMALAVFAMAGSAYAAQPEASTPAFTKATTSISAVKGGTAVFNEVKLPQGVSFEEFAKKQGLTAEQLIEKLKKDGTLDHLAEAKGQTVEEAAEFLKKNGLFVASHNVSPAEQGDGKTDGTARNTIKAVLLEKNVTNDNGQTAETVEGIALPPSLSFEEFAKAQGLTVDELIARLKEDGTLGAIAKANGKSVEDAIEFVKKNGLFAAAEKASLFSMIIPSVDDGTVARGAVQEIKLNSK
ncbi:hypothetical protein ACFVVQ_18725 [Paenibacillus chitinolyticus]|uniref:hypothetical protein n=1 Tax=Paenibacillus chitinolyticus TaxID=79263 RepID=UPI0036D7DAC1